MNLAPTASTTATLALGDALAMALSSRRVSSRRTLRTCIRADGWAAG
jgi:D-arabinose 5-phosphate isomerase GutQ